MFCATWPRISLPITQQRRTSPRSQRLLGPLRQAFFPSAQRTQVRRNRNQIRRLPHQQQRSIDRLKKAEQRHIPEWFDYRSVSGLSREMQEKLLKIRPRTLGHASRIPGVTPAAVSLVNVYIEIQARRREQAAAL